MNLPPSPAAVFDWHAGWRYGLMGLPLAFVALPLYVTLPNHYATAFGVPLATLGAVLLAARLLDALIDPLLGRWSDRLFAQSLRAVLAWAALACAVLGAGFALLFFPPFHGPRALVLWATACLVVTYAAYSALSILHQSWGARLGGDEVQRSRVVAWREGLGLLGVVLASIVPLALGLSATAALFFVALGAGWAAWRVARKPPAGTTAASEAGFFAGQPASVWLPFTRPAFRALLAVFVVNGIASAVPATLILFFVQDRLQAPKGTEAVFLGSYFVCAALALPLWLRAVPHLGLARTWLAGMLLSMVVFVFAAQLGANDTPGFVAVCVLSGIALGTDLALPGALLAGCIAAAGDRGRTEGAYFGWWNFATKLNLALAAGVALPLLGLLGYTPGTRAPEALQVLTIAYCLLPCVLKAAAAALLYTLVIRKTP
ncbi:MAG: MFS transporter [Curvibacter sp. RIFCSPHIGHO2_12_FULL_63_18]|uniref:MFS transporter n=1 Tax=Rhodoferax sp. TaxID=50421 RepID=UPI0008B445C4|nr:MFS transporter [Rhodoferax sp.]OGO94717.1 MAG: MFS transporter [Curvibacter sp. GWA2_63_95]OGP06881.1 MAG: MFS transporter [Curvibacter sp. RIFCSPHIGHO2_12_FULL_63_18]HCX80214.1 MFS transporter [Rhodoferax sp.]